METATRTPTERISSRDQPLDHEALIYRGTDEYIAGCRAFAEAAAERGEPLLLAVSRPHLRLLRPLIEGDVRCVDMQEAGRNPGRIIPLLRAWAEEHAGRRVRVIGEPIWPERSGPEMIEATRHEALVNVALADLDAHMLCPYDESALHPAVIDDAGRTHPVLTRGSVRTKSRHYADPHAFCAPARWPLSAAPKDAASYAIDGDLAALRRSVRVELAQAGLPSDRAEALLLAVNEAATNTLLHSGNGGTLRVWQLDEELVCEIEDGGWIDDLLAGLSRPSPHALRGRGLWLINELCDLVELRSGETGTVVRLRAQLV